MTINETLLSNGAIPGYYKIAEAPNMDINGHYYQSGTALIELSDFINRINNIDIKNEIYVYDIKNPMWFGNDHRLDTRLDIRFFESNDINNTKLIARRIRKINNIINATSTLHTNSKS